MLGGLSFRKATKHNHAKVVVYAGYNSNNFLLLLRYAKLAKIGREVKVSALCCLILLAPQQIIKPIFWVVYLPHKLSCCITSLANIVHKACKNCQSHIFYGKLVYPVMLCVKPMRNNVCRPLSMGVWVPGVPGFVDGFVGTVIVNKPLIVQVTRQWTDYWCKG